MKFLEYRPEMEETHFAELNALENQQSMGDTPNFSECEFGSIRMSEDPPDISQSAQPSAGDGALASWQVVSEAEQEVSRRDNAVEMLDEHQNTSHDDVGISAEGFDSLLEQAHISVIFHLGDDTLSVSLALNEKKFSC